MKTIFLNPGDSFQDALDEAAVAGVDLQNITNLDIHGHVHYGTSLERSRLGGTLNRIALKARLGLRDLELHKHCWFDANQLVTSVLQLNFVIFLQPLGNIAHDIFAKGQLLVGGAAFCELAVLVVVQLFVAVQFVFELGLLLAQLLEFGVQRPASRAVFLGSLLAVAYALLVGFKALSDIGFRLFCLLEQQLRFGQLRIQRACLRIQSLVLAVELLIALIGALQLVFQSCDLAVYIVTFMFFCFGALFETADLSGELTNADSVHFIDSLKYETLREHRIVYGGGGIMPDYFVPLDTTLYTRFHRQLAAKSIIIQQNLRYVDNNRKELKAQWTNFADFKQRFEVPQSLIDAVVAEGEKQNVKPQDEAELEKTLPYLRLQMKALIARDLWDMSEYFSIFNESSEIVKKALEVIQYS